MIKYFFGLLIAPAKTIRRLNQQKPPMRSVCAFLLWAGLLRGAFEILWIFLIAGGSSQLIISLKQPSWYFFEGVPFLLANVTTAFFRWALFSLLALWALRFLNRDRHLLTNGSSPFPRYSDLLRQFGIIMGLYPAAALINLLYIFWKLPFIKFRVSEMFQPAIGIGQVVTGIMTVFLIYKVMTVLFGLSRSAGMLVGLWIVLFDRASYILSSWIFFNMPVVMRFSYAGIAPYSIILFVILTGLTTPVFLWLGHRKGT